MNRRTTLGLLLLVPVAWSLLLSRGTAAPEAELLAAIRAATGEAEPSEGGITLTLPARAENGAQVPLAVAVDSPQTEALHVRSIHLIATRNPTPGIAVFQLSPALARAEVQTRIRVAQDQAVIAIARMSDGTVRRAAAEARVVVGGCM
jgi:sulfur-oxidizing protein SoxY